MLDTSKVIRAYLAAQSTLTAVVGNRIYCPGLPQSDDTAVLYSGGVVQPAISFFARPGECSKYTPIIEPNYQFKCWGGADPKVARQVYGLLHDVLHGVIRQTTVKGVIESALNDDTGQDLIDIDTEWRYVLTFYSFIFKAD